MTLFSRKKTAQPTAAAPASPQKSTRNAASIRGQTEALHALLYRTATGKPGTMFELAEVTSALNRVKIDLEKRPALAKQPAAQLFGKWLDFLLEEPNLIRHLQLIRSLQTALVRTNRFSADALSLTIYPASAIFSYQLQGKALTLKLHESLILMDERTVQAFAETLAKKDKRGLSSLARAVFMSETAQRINQPFKPAQRAQRKSEQAAPQGRCFDLRDSFARVNQTYFHSEIQMPGLRWSAAPNKARMGSYNYATDVIMINRLLDDSRTPAFVLDYVMYHELLHKVLGYKMRNGRVRSHTAKFRELERQFSGSEDAERFLTQLRVR